MKYLGQAVPLAVLLAGGCETKSMPWQTEENHRWATLEIAPGGKAGFTRMDQAQTGIAFINILSEWDSAANRILENGSGVAIGDYDGDGLPDIFLASLTGRNALYRNLGGWKFQEVTPAAGIQATNYICRGAVFADVDSNRSLDLLITTLGAGVLCFENDGRGTFRNITAQAGTSTRFGSMTLALGDLDGNGTLDLYVANYRSDDIRDKVRVPVQFIGGKPVVPPALRDRLLFAGQTLMEFGEPDVLYLNDGKGHFTAVPWTGGRFMDDKSQILAGAPLDWGLSAAIRDINGDGFPDIYVCNDYWTPDRIWLNDGKGNFQTMPRLAVRHTSENSMGVDFADIDRDGHQDFFVTDMLSRDLTLRKRQALAQTRLPTAVGEIATRPQIMRNTLQHNRGDGTFEQIADSCGVAASEWSWQPVFIDVDLDGYEDLLIPAGHSRDIQDLDATTRIRSLQHPWPQEGDLKALQEAFTREMMEHARIYPELPMPIVAYRNLQNGRFEDFTGKWDTDALGVHHGIALGDLDSDGDLDFVINNLNSAAGIYRNESSAPRIAVRLRGLPPNTQAIGARVKLRGRNLPVQMQEVMCGGRYLSGFDTLLVFAAETNLAMSLEIIWRRGTSTRIANVRANRIYEVEEAGAQLSQEALASQQPDPLFEDVSERIAHVHKEVRFDDFARQPLLPKRLSQTGPGVAWFDVDGDQHEDLLIANGATGWLDIFRNRGGGRFERFPGIAVPGGETRDQTAVLGMRGPAGHGKLLVGLSNYEDGLEKGAALAQFTFGKRAPDVILPATASSTGPLALGDFDEDGDLDLFVGGRVVPGRYPEAASSRLYRQVEGRWEPDDENSRLLEKVGLVSGAVWSDLDQDGTPELLLACEWGPIRIFRRDSERLREITKELGLAGYTGLWNGVATGDFDSDGRLDIVASNWGLNSRYRASREHPLRLYYGDFMKRGTLDLIEAEFDPARGRFVPLRGRDYLGAGIPIIQEQFVTFREFSEATIEEVLERLSVSAAMTEVTTLASTLFLNRGDQFDPVALPREAQWAPAFGANVADFDNDGAEDIFLSQNFFALPWDTPRLDAGRGLLLRGDGTGKFRAVSGHDSGLKIYGEQRGSAVCDFDEDGRADLVVSQNGAATKLYRNLVSRRGLRVQLKGAGGNPAAVGAAIRLKFGDRWGAVREIQAGSGYWSQNSAIQVMGADSAMELQVRWPGGKLARQSIAPGTTEIELNAAKE